MIKIFENKNVNLEVIKGNELYFKAKDVARALGQENTNRAVKKFVFSEYKINACDIRGYRFDTTFNHQKNTLYITEPGLYQLICGSQTKEAKEFQRWVFETVIPEIRKTGCYVSEGLQVSIKNEFDLHSRVVAFIKRFYPEVIITAGLGENQDTSDKRIKSWKKGYTKGQPDIILQNLHKKYNGFCIEFKTPLGTGVLSEAQAALLKKFEMNGYKCMISNDYDLIIKEIIEYAKDLRVQCSRCNRRFKSEETLQRHMYGFHHQLSD